MESCLASGRVMPILRLGLDLVLGFMAVMDIHLGLAI